MRGREGADTYTVLAVDDELMIKRTVRKLLENSAAFRVTGEAEDGEEALAFIERERPDVVITDITMPVMDGLELIGRLQRLKEKPEIVILSGYDDFPYIQEAIRHGVADYLLKPIKPEDFRATMERVAERLREKAKTEAPRFDWLPLCEATGKRLADSVWLLRPEEIDATWEDVRLWIEERSISDTRVGRAPQANEVCADLLHFAASELRRRGGTEGAFPSLPDVRAANDDETAFRLAKESLLEAMERIRQSRNWVNHRHIRSSIERVNASFADPTLSMQQLADAASMSPAYFSRSFKAETGVTFVQYVTRLRMERAKELLTDPTKSMNDAARAAGYVDYPHFTKAFKKYFGIKPSDYRKRLGIS
ncbi:response regulator transcription factor [Paenibacillus antri]|nr:response regulator [Paenibacillus antri]